MFLRLAIFFGLPIVVSSLVGCRGPQQPQPQAPYTGPTESLDAVVQKIDANNSRLPTLWAHQDFNGTIVDDKHNPHAVGAHGVALYRAPHDLLIRANNEFGPIFEIGCTDDLYWLKVNPELDTMWWGHVRNLGKPCSRQIPIRPDLIRDVLAIGTIDTNLAHEPFPVMRFNNDLDVYMVDSIIRAPDRLLVQKEVWYDRRTMEPRTVLLFDPGGRVVLRAHLGDFQPVQAPGEAPDRWPKVATKYSIFFPDTGSKMQFTLSDQALTKNGVPRAGGIAKTFDLSNAGVKSVIQIDEDCDR